jgi:MYXO-CTERM domain-containing protein
MKFVGLSRRSAPLAIAATVAAVLGAPRAIQAATATLVVPPGVTLMKGILVFSATGLGPGWGKSAPFQDLAKRLSAGIVFLGGTNEFGSYANRCDSGEFKGVLDTIAMVGKANGHPELANAPIVGSGHSHGGDYWNYFNACIPERFALIFDKSSGGVQYSGAALKTPMVWEIGTNDLFDHVGPNFRGQMLAHRPKGQAIALVLGPGETHGGFTAGSATMVTALIEAIFKLRVPADADPSKGPVKLNEIDESSGQYWLGNNYTKEVSPWAMSPDRDKLYNTSFLPGPDIAAMWKAAGAPLPMTIKIATGGVCTGCYKQPAGEPPGGPTMGGPTPGGTGGAAGTDAGTPPPASSGGAGGTPPPASNGGSTGSAPPVSMPPSSPPPTTPPDPVKPAGGSVKGGCSVGGTGGDLVSFALGLVGAGVLVARRRKRS